MPLFRYSAVEPLGKVISGEIAAKNAATARAKLEQQGLHVQELAEASTFQSIASEPALKASASGRPLSSADALQLAAHLADLAGAGVPLDTGLRALAQDLPRGRLAKAIERLAGHLERGVSLDAAVSMPDVRLPPHVLSLVTCGARSGQLHQVLARFLEHQQLAGELRRRLWSALVYPAILVLLLAGWCLFVLGYLLPNLAQMYREMDITLPASTQFLLQLSRIRAGILVPLLAVLLAILVGVCLGRRRAFLANLLAGVPLFGQLWRNIGLAEACSLLGLLLENGIPLARALELTSSASADGGVAAGCQAAAGLAAAGRPWSECLAETPPFPPSLVPVAAWGDRHSAQPAALASAAELLRVRVEQRAQVLRLVVPPAIFLGMTATIILFVTGLFSPMMRFIHYFSSWWKPAAAPDPGFGILTGSISLMLLGITLLLSLRVLALKEAEVRSDPVSLAIDTAGWILITLGSLVFYCSLASWLGFLLWMGSVIIAFVARSQWNRLPQRSHLALLAAAAAKQIPLVECARAFGEEQRGAFRRRVLKFATALEQGVPLTAAIRQSPSALPRSAQLAASVGEQSSQLSAALQEEAAGLSNFDPLRHAFGARLLYLAAVLLLAQLPVLYTFVRVMPSFRKIFLDFDAELPPLSRWVFDLSEDPWFYLVLFLVSVCWLALVLWGTAWYTGWAFWLPPVMRRWLLRFDRSAILRALAHPASRRQPLEPMIEQLAASYPRRWVRQRLLRAHQRIVGGQDWIAGLRVQSLLGQADGAVLEAAQRAGNLAWALREMADSNQRRLIYRLQALLQIGSVLLLLCLGACALLIAVAVFGPLALLISELAHAR